MAFCNNCGSKNDDYADYCGNCGSTIQPISQEQPTKGFQENAQRYQPQDQGYQQMPQGYQQGAQNYQQSYQQGYLPGQLPPRTGWLTFVIVLYWIGIVVMGIGGLFLFFIFPPFGLILFVLAGLMIWLVKELAKYNNTARIIVLVLTVLSALADLTRGNILGLIIGGLIIYALGFDKPTKELFIPTYQIQPQTTMQKY